MAEDFGDFGFANDDDFGKGADGGFAFDQGGGGGGGAKPAERRSSQRLG